MKLISFILLLLCFLVTSWAFSNELVGEYKTNPTVFPGFKQPYTEKIRQAIEHLTYRLIITKDKITVFTDIDESGIEMEYTVEGDYILGSGWGSKDWKYTPFFVENPNTIHGLGTIFFKEKEEPKE